MANISQPRGFLPVRYLNGAAWNGGTNLYHIPSTDTNQYNPGDAVKTAATGADANGIPDVAKITNGTDTVRGVVVGCLTANPNTPSLVGTNLDLTVQNIPATKTRDYYVLVVDDPQVVFQIQDDGITTANLVAASVGLNASFTVTNPTSPQQNSATVLLSSSFATTQGLNCKILGLAQLPNNSFGAKAQWLIKFNQHELMGNTAGI
jgi:hypothetical protein